MKRSDSPRAYRALGLSFFIIGALILIAGLICFIAIENTLGGYTATEATITGVDGSRTSISYIADGQRLDDTLAEYSSNWRTGGTITVYYDPAHPERVSSGISGWIVRLVCGILGGVFLALGTVFLVICGRMERKRRTLMDYGTPITAEVTGLKINRNVRMNMRHPKRLQCRYTTPDGQAHIFLSNDVWTPLDDSVIGCMVTVYVDGNDMKEFYVDADSLEGLKTIYHGA